MPEATEDMDMTEVQLHRLDALARSTIHLHLANFVYFIVLESKKDFAVWQKLCSTYEKNTTNYKIFLMRSLYNLKMKEYANVASQLNEFDSLFARIRSQNMNINDEMKAIHLLCSFPLS